MGLLVLGRFHVKLCCRGRGRAVLLWLCTGANGPTR